METEDLLRVILPSWLFDYFDFVELKQSDSRLDIYLDEKKIIPTAYRGQTISSHGFTDRFTVQDFPIRDKEVFLHIRRRKWLLLETKQIVSQQYDINYQGTKLTKEFVAFLKATN